MRTDIVRRARRAPSLARAVLGALLLPCFVVPAAARQAGRVEVIIQAVTGEPVREATVRLQGAGVSGTTGADGRVLLGPVAAGEYAVVVSRIGYRQARTTIRVIAGQAVQLRVTLVQDPIQLEGLEISVLRPDLSPTAALDSREIAEANAHDAGGLLRMLPGLDAVRRGGLGLDPVVRGLRETQVGVYVDGFRSFPGGPGGMDTQLSHVDPAAIRSLEIIKGPYALTWGAGNMSAIRIETLPLPGEGAAAFGTRVFTGYDTNLDGAEAGVDAAGAMRGMRYALGGAWRRAGDYTAGDGAEVQGAFRSAEARAKVGVRVSANSGLTLSGSHQAQRDIDYPGRPLDADYFDTFNGSARWELTRRDGVLRGLDALAYGYDIDHEMSNDAKPTALPDPGRTPPFPLDISTRSGIRVYGGRLAASLVRGRAGSVEVGGDVYHATHDARRTIDRRDTGAAMARHLIWGGARIMDAGVFTRLERPVGRVGLSAAVRLDRVDADADSVSEFFRTNVSPVVRGTETNLSGALSMGVPLSANWTVAAGVGSVVRTADANERYSDRNAARKMQIGAEFVGDPALSPERSTQLDLGVEAGYPGLSVTANLFARRIDDHITIEPTTLPRQSAMSAPVVYRYVNGEATYWGWEATAVARLPIDLTLSAATSFLRGRDVTVDEPAFGVPPLRGDLRLRWEPARRRAFLEGGWRGVVDQDRVGAARGEVSTPGHHLLDLQGGFDLSRRVRLRAGVNNLTDIAYVNHLNANNPFTGGRVPEPGRVGTLRAEYRY